VGVGQHNKLNLLFLSSRLRPTTAVRRAGYQVARCCAFYSPESTALVTLNREAAMDAMMKFSRM
jgi:hypothetical protein